MNKIYLGRLRLNQGGYDRTGRYFGIGSPLYSVQYDMNNETFTMDIRANDREDAKKTVLILLATQYPGTTFTFYR